MPASAFARGPLHVGGRCWACLRPVAACLCARFRPFATRTRILIAMHPEEWKKQKTGTGRILHQILENSEIHVGIRFDAESELAVRCADPAWRTWLMYPDRTSVGADAIEREPDAVDRPRQIVLIDGTWGMARQIYNQSPALRSLQKVHLPVTVPSAFAIKRQPRPECVCTLETADRVLALFEESGAEPRRPERGQLEEALAEIVRLQKEWANRSFRRRANRPILFTSGEKSPSGPRS